MSLSQEDRAAWAAFACRIAPLPGRAASVAAMPVVAPIMASVPMPDAAGIGIRVASATPPTLPPAAPCLAASADPRSPPAGLDRATWRRLQAGRIAVEATLDLHGHVAHDAHRRLRDFLLGAHAARRRCVEIITGRGRDGGGILRRELPCWLEDPVLRRLVVVALQPPANPGCVRLLLRRHRP